MSTTFTTDPQGANVTLMGTSGLFIRLTGFRGDVANWTAATSQASSGPLLLQVYKLGDFEGTVSLGAGAALPACANVAASANTLVFTFIPPPY